MTTTFGVYPAEDALTEGEQISSTYEGRHITLDVSDVESAAGSGQCTKGLPIVCGHIVGIAFDTKTTGQVAIDTEGIWIVDVLAEDDDGASAVVGGDELFIAIATPCVVSKISSTVTNIPFGYALGDFAAGTMRIAVKLHWHPIDDWVANSEKLYFGDARDTWLIPTGDEGYGGILAYSEWTVAGQTGRILESRMLNNVLLGGYANALKGYMDCDASGGSTGLLSGINGEIRLPDAAGAGAYFALEGEVVFQTSSTITPYGSTAGFLHLGITPAGIADFQDDGVFMSVWGLTNEANHLLSLDYHTLRCDFVIGGAHLTKYLVLSLAENYIYHDFSALDANGRMAKFYGTVAQPLTPDTQGFFDVKLTISGIAGGPAFTSVIKLAPGADCTLAAGSLYGAQHLVIDQITNVSATITGAFCMERLSLLLDDAPGYLSIWQLNFSQEIGAIFAVNDPAKALGYAAGSATTVIGSVPFMDNPGGGAQKYIAIYDSEFS